MITVRLAGKFVAYTDLQWSAVDPGGFESCSFSVDRNTVWTINPADDILVLDGQSVCWHGYVEEPGLRSDGGRETYNVGGVGYGAKLKQNSYSMVYIDRNLSEFKPMPILRDISISGTGFVQDGSFQVASGEASDGKPSLVLGFESFQNTAATHIGIAECWYDAGYGNTLSEVRYSYETYDKTAGGLNVGMIGSWVKKIGFSSDDIGTAIPLNTLTLSSDTNQSFVTTFLTGRRYALVQIYFNATSTQIGNWKLIVEHLQLIGKHGLSTRGTFPDQGFYPSDIVTDAIRRSMVNFDNIIDDSVSYTIPQLVFRTPTTPETIIDTASKFVGWHWGVWEPQSIFSDIPTFYFQAPPEKSTAIVRYNDCETLDITEKLSEMFNRAIVSYTLPNGTAASVTVTKSHPRLPDNIVQTISLDAGVVGSASVARVIGVYQLALLQDAVRSAGSFNLPTTLADGQPAHLLRPGRDKLRVLGMPTADKIITDRTDALRIRRISVSVSNRVPHTQIEFDHGADLIEVLQARLANAQEASNISG